MAPHAHRRPRARRARVAVLVLAPFVVVALMWVSLAAPFRAHGDAAAGGGARDVGLRAEAVRRDDRAQVTVAGRVPAGERPVVVRIVGMRDVAAACPAPVVGSSGTVALPSGGVRVGWERIAGRVPGAVLRPGSRFTMAGTVALRGSGAMRLCVHLLRAGDRPAVLRTVRSIVPSRAGITPPSVVLRPVVHAVVLPVARIVGFALVVALLLAVVVAGVRRWRLVRPSANVDDAAPAIVPPPWAAAALPPLPSDVHVPDVVPWAAGDDLFAGLGPAPEDPHARPSTGTTTVAVSPLPTVADGEPGTADQTPVPAAAETPDPDAGAAPNSAVAESAVLDAGVVPDAGAGALSVPVAGGRPSDGRRRAHDAGRRALATLDRARRATRTAGTDVAPTPHALDAEAARYPAVHALRDRRVPGRTGTALDHLLVGPAGVLVARTRGWSGGVRVADDRLFVRGLDRTRAVDQVCVDVSAVRSALTAAGLGAIPVTGALLSSRPEAVGFDGTRAVRGVVLLDAPGAMLRAVDGGVLGREAVARVAETLDRALPPA